MDSEKIKHSHLIRMANWMQHYTGWVEMMKANYTALLVLENDAVLVEGFAEQLVQLWPSVSAHCDSKSKASEQSEQARDTHSARTSFS